MASRDYLPHLVENYGAVLDCTYCHTDNNGGLVTREFGKTPKTKGLLVGHMDRFDAAMTALDCKLALVGLSSP